MRVILIGILLLIGCRDYKPNSIRLTGPVDVTCYIGDAVIYQGTITGKALVEQKGNGWNFHEDGGDTVHVQGHCVFQNK